jgi:hypothetical protein
VVYKKREQIIYRFEFAFQVTRERVLPVAQLVRELGLSNGERFWRDMNVLGSVNVGQMGEWKWKIRRVCAWWKKSTYCSRTTRKKIHAPS